MIAMWCLFVCLSVCSLCVRVLAGLYVFSFLCLVDCGSLSVAGCV